MVGIGLHQYSPLKCRNPDAKIRLWYDDDPLDKAIVYQDQKRLHPGSQRPIIHFQAIYGDEIESQRVQLFLDTVPPAIKNHTTPSDEVVYTNKDSFTITVRRDFIEMLTNGGPSHQVADGVYISNNHGEYIEILEPTIFNVFNPEGIAQEWEHEVELVEGENIITILGRDQACNEETWTRKIIKDTAPPEIEIVEPVEGKEFEAYEFITVKVKTEVGSKVYIDTNVANMTVESIDGFAFYQTKIELEDTDKDIRIEVIDKAGNKSSKVLTVKVKHENSTRLKLWLNSEKFFKNGEQMVDLDPMPTTQSPPLPSGLEGNTYMPVRAVYEALGATVGWDGNERRVDATLGDIKVQLWIDNPVAKINGLNKRIVSADGKTPLYPTIVNNRTMLPLRFAIESVGAEANWIADEQAIEIVYPSGK
ncbi:MAG: stalk domain-containing protein [Caldisericia bacterium]